MTRTRSFDIRSPLVKMFSHSYIEELARETRAVVRDRKVCIVSLFWSLVLGFGGGRERTISGLRRMYEASTGQRIEESSFYNRFNYGLVALLRRAVAEAFRFLPGTYRSLEGSLSTFSDLIMTDSTIMKLHDMLAGTFPGVRTNHSPSSLKVHAVLSICGLGTSSVRITSGNRHDGVVFSVGKWVRDKLLLFDLGYYKFQLFSCIDRNGGFFVSRVKTSSDFEIVADNLPCRGRSVSLVGEKLQSVSQSLLRQSIDVMVRMKFSNRSYRGSRSGNEKKFRVVGIRNDAKKCYHFYITNVPPEKLSATDIQTVYAARWEIELLFKELKSQYRLDNLPSAKREVVEALVYASLLTLITGRTLLAAFCRERRKPPECIPKLRWSILFAMIAPQLLLVVVQRPRETSVLQRLLAQMIIHEAEDPNRNRPGLLAAVENRTHVYKKKPLW